MATASANLGPQPTSSFPPTAEQLQSAFENSIWYLLSLWSPLHIAVQNSWGGPSSSDKRDWFAGAVSELFTTQPATDAEDLEVFLLQVMQDEFECNVEDESECEVAMQILRVRSALMESRTLDAAREVEERWRRRGMMKGEGRMEIVVHEVNQDADEEEWNGFDNGEVDEEMDEAPTLVQAAQPPKEKAVPEVDEDGFTKVVGKRGKK